MIKKLFCGMQSKTVISLCKNYLRKRNAEAYEKFCLMIFFLQEKYFYHDPF